MKVRPLSGTLKRIFAICAILLVPLFLVWYWIVHPTWNQRVYRVGFDNNPPLHFPLADGTPSGLAVDLIDEAARRRGIRLRWQLEPESSEVALTTNRVDLWPLMTIRPERKGRFYITDPYREDTACLVVRRRSGFMRLTDLKKSRIVYDGEPI